MMIQPRGHRPGYVLIAVLLVVVVLTYAGYRYLDAMTAEYGAATKSTQAAQVKAYAISGVHFAMAALADPTYFQQTLGGNYSDNPNVFQNGMAGTGEGPRGGGRFSLMNVTNSGNGQFGLTYGVADESAKINVNAFMQIDPTGQALYDALMKLPNMTEDLADAIVDWLDADDTPRTAGAESGEYTSYRPKNGPINTIGELLLVRGMSLSMLYGSDLNRNGVLDPEEASGGELNRGLSEYLTAYGHEANVDSTGTSRVDLTGDTLSDVYEQLLAGVPSELADYIIAYRMFTVAASGGGSSTGGSTTTTTTTTATVTVSGGGSQTSTRTVVATGGGGGGGGQAQTLTASAEQVQSAVQLALSTGLGTSRRKPKSLFDMLNTQITLPRSGGAPNTPQFVYPSPLNNPDKFKEYLPYLLDKTTATPGTELIPRVNINSAPREVLMAIPGMTDEMADQIVSTRTSLDPLDPATTTAAWLVTQLGMPSATFNTMSKYITGTTQVYRVQSMGYFANGGPTARVEAVFDTNLGKPRIVFFRDLTELGKGFDPPR